MLAYAYMHNMGWGWGILMTLGWLALLGLFVGVLVTTLRDRRGESPREVLDRRLATGEIDIKTYRSARDAMSDAGSGRPPAPA
jgi:putative membrane protein